VDNPVFYCTSKLQLYFYPIGLQAAIIVVLAFNLVDIPAFELLIVYYSKASRIPY